MTAPKRVLVWAEELEEHAPNVYRLRILGEGVHLEDLFWAHEFLDPFDPALVEAVGAAIKGAVQAAMDANPTRHVRLEEFQEWQARAALSALAEFGKEKRDANQG